MTDWDYETERPKVKHKWDCDHAGFVEREGEKIGKCPNNLSPNEARKLLNEAFTAGLHISSSRWRHAHPERIFIVHQGVVYRAKVTTHGRSYHAFPELPERLRGLPSTLRERILERARTLGCEQEVLRWMRQ